MAKEYQPATLVDALFDFDGGVNQTRSPLKLPPDVMSLATNVTVRNDGGGGRDQRSKTPPAFRDALIRLARTSS